MRKPIDTDSPEFRANAERRRQTWSVTAFKKIGDMKAAEYAYWATQPAHIIMATVADMTADAYAMKGIDVSRLQRTPGALE